MNFVKTATRDENLYPVRNNTPAASCPVRDFISNGVNAGYRFGQFPRGFKYPTRISNGIYNRGQSMVGVIIVFVLAGLTTSGLYLYFYKQTLQDPKTQAGREFIKPERFVGEKPVLSPGATSHQASPTVLPVKILAPTLISNPTPVTTSGPTKSELAAERPGPSLVSVVKPAPPAEVSISVSPKEKLPNPFGSINIKGDENCISQTQEALKFLQNKAITHYAVVDKYVGIIECTETGSGMYAWEQPPRYQVGKATYNAGTTWYAGTITHDACHSKLYQDYLTNNPVASVPNEVFSGKAAEAQCLDVQYDALTKLGADQNTLNYVKNVINSEYWNIDYGNRWW